MPQRQPSSTPSRMTARTGRIGPSDMGVRMDIDIETVLWLAIGGIVVIGVIGIAASLWAFIKSPK